jgi:3-hydroxybutyryl-CoA dehydrogenase
MAEIKKVGVLGCGLMGSGIAQVAATAGYTTVVREVAEAPLAKGKAGIVKSLDKFVEKAKLTQADRDKTLARLSYVTDVTALRDCDIVIEAVTEDLELKNDLWKQLDDLCPAQTIFASNTSSLTIAAMAAATKRADRFVGLHFFNPVPLMQLVEVVRTVTTSAAAFDRAFAFARSLGKEAVAAKDNSGFIVNLLLVPYLLDAIRALESGVASTTDIDNAMKLGCGYPMGRAAAAAQADGHGRDVRQEERQGVLRLQRDPAGSCGPGCLIPFFSFLFPLSPDSLHASLAPAPR